VTSRIYKLSLVALALFSVVAYAADEVKPDCGAEGQESCGDDNEAITEDATSCRRTAKRYRIADYSNEVCYVKTCCTRRWNDRTLRYETQCRDYYVGCITVIVD
jgi:hypothetical protein